MRVLAFLLVVVASAHAQCAPGYYGSSGCTLCAANTFAYFRGSLACQSCPPYTYSAPGASACVACGGSSPVPCNSSCTACAPGTYNDGSTSKCIGCPPGTFSTTTKAVSVTACSACDAGTSTRPTDTGRTACTACAALNQTTPLNAQYIPSADPLVCAWACNMGYMTVNATAATARVVPGYTLAQSLALYHVGADYCCSPTLAGIGTYLSGCNRSFEGFTLPCPAVANGYYIFASVPKINRCADWVCNPDFYATRGACYAQPACQIGYTYQRDSASGGFVTLANGSFVCVPCSRCMDGSEPVGDVCNRTVDTRCRLCSPTAFSVGGGWCVPAVPYGYLGVIVRLTSVPAVQGRPATRYDGTPIDWSGMLFSVNTLVACRSIPTFMMYTGTDAPCRRLDTAPDACAQPVCASMCRPWNGSVGWFMRAGGQCAPCAYDLTCAADQYSDMTACFGNSPPVCRACPSELPANAIRWVNPMTFKAQPPVCDFVCRSGYTKSNGSQCIYCPNLPLNARATVGCDWVCSLGFYQSGQSSLCVPCAGVSGGCGIGAYLGYPDGEQCARCMPCTNVVARSVYTSTGLFNGPNTCGIKCVQGAFVDPDYGTDIFGNPVACAPCSTPACVPGESFQVPCAADRDAYCQGCSGCAPGFAITKPCTVGADTQCTACGPPPVNNASWTYRCSEWACDPGFYSNGTTRCVACLKPSDCARSDRYDEATPGCGRCIACNPTVLLPGQCFNGDGQCGATYRCGATTSRQTTTTTTRATTTPPPTTTAITIYYASLVVMATTLPFNSSRLTCRDCTFRILSITRNNVTTYSQRRLLEQALIEIAVISSTPVIPIITDALFQTAAYAVPNATTLNDPLLLSQYLRAMEPQPARQPHPNLIALGAAGALVAMFTLLTCAAFCCRGRRRRR